MSDTPDRRYEDAKMNNIETNIKNMGKDLELVKQKIFNGFSHSIASTEEKVNYIDDRNREAHGALIKDVQNLSDKFDKKFDKMMWIWISGSASIFIGVITYIIKGILE